MLFSLVTLWSRTPPSPTTRGAPALPTPSTGPPTKAATQSVTSGPATPSTWSPNTWSGELDHRGSGSLRSAAEDLNRNHVWCFFREWQHHDSPVCLGVRRSWHTGPAHTQTVSTDEREHDPGLIWFRTMATKAVNKAFPLGPCKMSPAAGCGPKHRLVSVPEYSVPPPHSLHNFTLCLFDLLQSLWHILLHKQNSPTFCVQAFQLLHNTRHGAHSQDS